MAGRKIEALRTDNGGEFTSTEFTDFYKEAGIKREKIVSYNHSISISLWRRGQSCIPQERGESWWDTTRIRRLTDSS
jgi:transposase InsO family protein